MDSLDDILEILEGPSTTKKTSTKNKKRKWREIEALKDKHRLRKELQELDYFTDSVELDELDF
ncbi:DUF3545 family protein [Pseudoalteromonas shioyasakiensis]|jgi:hypothetical protein|uniref:DUF3545 family protein n=1 Tax=Pseudoalteromonas lipolytica TaxID=570156 RepID=A0A0P7D0S5_9GAMM|nr:MULTISPECIES: DUF3545 family protein [Pseudoalteromonas]MAH28882.1 DUF3545 domain-containing protein [Pseudoalteromonadaceae bacterium]MEC8225395.1 DUF3545 family protein [Pseudomonadota bacterium]KPM81713.1 hypothetical protein AOG27_17275 [Pseudoalteromonas lipolytica]MAD03042.1 DUF3545 domain-containing protein [Pseudoalteromonas sp.]MBC7010394.1 DUF3545 family protein [Pseudoalteromonas sp. BZK2]|tara:strand:+ start:3273 stop:3461 length:189 start_codon:yes stop_codon:yes gene_type:complete